MHATNFVALSLTSYIIIQMNLKNKMSENIWKMKGQQKQQPKIVEITSNWHDVKKNKNNKYVKIYKNIAIHVQWNVQVNTEHSKQYTSNEGGNKRSECRKVVWEMKLVQQLWGERPAFLNKCHQFLGDRTI